MRIFFGCRYGLGDILSGYFCPTNNHQPNRRAELLMRLRNACLAGACSSAFVVTNLPFWEFLDFPLRVKPRECFDVPLPANGWYRDELAGHRNLLRPPIQLFDFSPGKPIRLPTRKPIWPVPQDFILFTDGAGAADRALEDKRIIDWLRSYLPVVRIGSSGAHYCLPMGPRGSTAADVDLCDQTDLTEVFWLAKAARVIVAPFTYLRTMSSLWGTPVIELAQSDRVKRGTLLRTAREYAGGQYGMSAGETNFWYTWNQGGAPPIEARRCLELVLRIAEKPKREWALH
jgi:hypothetical protein